MKTKADKWNEQIEAAAEMGIAIAGHKKALNAALITQHQICSDLFKFLHGAVDISRQKRPGEIPTIRLDDDALDVINNAIGSCAMVVALMSKGCLDKANMPEENLADDPTFNLDHSRAVNTRH